MSNQELFMGRDHRPVNYQGEPNSKLVNPNPGIKSFRYPEEFFPDVEDLAFPDMNEEQILEFLKQNQYHHPRKLEDGSWVALYMLAFTWSICTDITKQSPYAYRWCFNDPEEAMYFLATVKEFDEVPTRTTSLKGHRFDSGYARLIEWDSLGLRKW